MNTTVSLQSLAPILGKLVLVFSLAVLACGHLWASDTSTIQAGVARVNLTPPLEMKAALGGYGARMSKPAVGVHDNVWAKALVVEKGGRRFAL